MNNTESQIQGLIDQHTYEFKQSCAYKQHIDQLFTSWSGSVNTSAQILIDQHRLTPFTSSIPVNFVQGHYRTVYVPPLSDLTKFDRIQARKYLTDITAAILRIEHDERQQDIRPSIQLVNSPPDRAHRRGARRSGIYVFGG